MHTANAEPKKTRKTMTIMLIRLFAYAVLQFARKTLYDHFL